MMIMNAPFDFHTHRLDATGALISVDPRRFEPQPGRWYSVGFHPWDTTGELGIADYNLLEQCASHPQVLAIGETGLDSLRGANMAVQHEVFARHLTCQCIEVGNIFHLYGCGQCFSKCYDLTADDLGMMPIYFGVDDGCYLSFGMKFNPHALQETPLDRLLIETDEDPTPIDEVAAAIAAQLHMSADEVISQTSNNARRLLQMP